MYHFRSIFGLIFSSVLGAIGGVFTGNVGTAQEELDATTRDVAAEAAAPLLTAAQPVGVDLNLGSAVDSIGSTTQLVEPVDTTVTEATTSTTDTVTTISENPTSVHHVVDATLDGEWNHMQVKVYLYSQKANTKAIFFKLCHCSM